MRLKSFALAGLALAIGTTTAVLAQRGPGPGPAPFGAPKSHVAGQFDYYALVLSWSPTHCATATPGRDDMQCRPRNNKRYSFVLHGLWPQYERGFPESCQTRERPFVPDALITRMLDIMPARGLVIHEYRKHGTCSGLSPEGYFETSRKLFSKVKIPDRFDEPAAAQFVSPAELIAAFVAANPGLKTESIAVQCSRPGDRLKEVRICFTRDGAYRACGNNENQSRLCSAARMYVPPVRPGAPGAVPNPKAPNTPPPLPGDRKI
ncbi:MAG TPA: ribonuclease T2 [Hyphomicrobiaceae bacterium]|nr:ribonuclease T2 [Hyphomicrobiaceae bacterium]